MRKLEFQDLRILELILRKDETGVETSEFELKKPKGDGDEILKCHTHELLQDNNIKETWMKMTERNQ